MLRPANRRRNEIKTDRFLVERFSEWIPGWGKRQLSYIDLNCMCESLGIEVVEFPLKKARGYALWAGPVPYIYVADHLSGPEKVITGFHELAHILYHPTHPEAFCRAGNLWNWGKCDRQAEIVGVIAWMPYSLARGLSVEELMEGFGVRREVAEFRAGLRL